MLIVAACGGTERFPLREPMLRDADERTFNPAPDEYVSPFAWDAANQTIFRPISRFFAVDPAGRAINVNAFDEVPDSSWFVNRLGTTDMTAEEIAVGSCGDQVLSVDAEPGSWIIDQGKPNGANPGFRVNIPGLGKFLLKADPAGEPERATGATAIATRIYHAVGFYAPCDSVVHFDPKLLSLKPGLKFTDNSGISRAFDQKALDRLLSRASHRDGLVRMGASRWLPGKPLGPYRYEGTRGDDPNDVVAHEDRRELRGARLLAAWLNHFDSREQNTMDIWVSDNPKDEKAPGFVRHYILDLGDCFGSVWASDHISRRLGHAYYFDFPYFVGDLATLGMISRPWDRAQQTGGIFNYFSSRDFDPEAWRGGYPNPAFMRMTESDGAWMARILANFDEPKIRAAVSVGQYTEVASRYLTQTLLLRRQAILERYLTRLSPISQLNLQGDRLCGTDLARAHGVVPDEGQSFAAQAWRGEESRPQRIFTGPGGKLCVELDRKADQDSYVVVEIANGYAEGLLRAHLYDLGAGRGYKLVGIERN
ncbi:MAG TPA: hypothetical protein VJV78_12520 [Polyangiales bacterium]|nr:hypothetical protein [Polyangiales bacterium]